MAGLPVDQIVGRSFIDVMGREAFETIRPLVDRVSRGETVRYESDAPFRAGGPEFLQVVYTPWRELDGTVNGWVASVTDITLLRNAQEGLRESENRLRAITDNLPIAIALYDRADRVLSANQEYRELAAKSDRPPTVPLPRTTSTRSSMSAPWSFETVRVKANPYVSRSAGI